MNRIGNKLSGVRQPVMTPMRDDVCVEILDAPLSDILVIPDAYKELPVRGRVLAVGPGRVNRYGIRVLPDVVAGEVIQFYFGGIEAYYPDRKHAIVKHSNIQAVIG